MKKYLARVIPHLKKQKYLAYAYSSKAPDIPELPASLKWDIITVEIVNRFIKDDEWRRITIHKLMRRGAIGIIIHDDNDWAAHAFISPPEVSLPDHLPVEIVKDPCWLMFDFVKPKWRGYGLHINSINLRLSFINTSFFHKSNIIIDTRVNNIPSRKNILKLGFEPSGVINTIELRLPFSSPKIIKFNWNHNEKHTSI